MSLDRFHVPILGFTQSSSRESGMEKIWRELRTKLPLETDCLVHPMEWDSDFAGLAEFIWRNGSNRCVVNVYAYSWGCGHGFVSLAKHLRRRGIQIPKAVLCDPVYHSWFRPWRGLFHASLNPPITVPDNVWHVDTFVQRQNTPQGTSIRLLNKNGRVNGPELLNCDHQYADDDEKFKARVLEVSVLHLEGKKRNEI